MLSSVRKFMGWVVELAAIMSSNSVIRYNLKNRKLKYISITKCFVYDKYRMDRKKER
jgi:hypothetical protein